MTDLAATLYAHLQAGQARALAAFDAAPLGVHFGGIAYERPIDTRSDAELRAVAEAHAQAVYAYEASPEGQAEAARLARLEADRVAVQRAFGLPA